MEREKSQVNVFLWAILLWIVVNLLPYFLIPQRFEQLNWYSTSLTITELRLLFVQSLLLVSGEAVLAVFLFGVLKGLKQKLFIRKVLLFFSFTLALAVLIYMFFLPASWGAFASRGFFLRFADLNFTSYLADWGAIKYCTSAQDFLLIAFDLSFAAFVSGIVIAFSPTICSARQFFVGGLCSALLFSSAFVVNLVDNGSLKETKLKDLSFLARSYISPQLTLYYPLIYLNPSSWKKVELELEPVSVIEQWKAQIPQDWKPKKNVIVFVVEAMRHDVLSAKGGDERIVPVVNSLASNGVSFAHTYATAPDTGYSLGAIITGLYPLKFEVRDTGFDFRYNFVRIYDLLTDVGYKSAYLTATEWSTSRGMTGSDKLDLYHDQGIALSKPTAGHKNGMDAFSPVPLEQLDRQNTALLKEWISQKKQANEPFFALYYFVSSHFPYTPYSNKEGAFPAGELKDNPSFFFPALGSIDVLRNRYWNTLHEIDSQIGEIVDQLKAEGLFDQTVIVVTGDHGELFGEHNRGGHTTELYEEVSRVPLVVTGADSSLFGNVELTASHVDIAPTILQLVGLPSHPNFQGRSLFTENNATALSQDNPARPVFSTVQMITFEDSLVLYPFKYVMSLRGLSDRLYDLSRDPKEQKNLVNQQKSLGKTMRGYLFDFRSRQLSYYSLPPKERLAYLPPSPPTTLSLESDWSQKAD